MRTPGQIAHKVQQVAYRHRKRELSRLLAEKPQNCVNNATVKTATGTVGVCRLDCKTCDAVVHDRVEGCPSFKLTHTAEELKASLTQFLRTAPIEEVAIRFPDVAALLWALDDPENPERGHLIPDATPTTSLWGVDLWVDTPEELEALSEIGRTYEEEQALLGALGRLLGVDSTELPAALHGLQKRLQELEQAVAAKGAEVAAAVAAKEAAEARARAAEATPPSPPDWRDPGETALEPTSGFFALFRNWRWPWQR